MRILDVNDILNERADTELFIFSLSKLLRDLNPGDLLVKQFLKIKKTPDNIVGEDPEYYCFNGLLFYPCGFIRLWFRGYLSGRND
ncbi:hypothetical protein Peur_067874 [Populus x canadensis]